MSTASSHHSKDAIIDGSQPATPSTHAAEPDSDAAGNERQNPDQPAEPSSSTTRQSTLPPGYVSVTVRLPGLSEPAVDSLPVEVLPCHSFTDVCRIAVARVPEAPKEYDIQAQLLLGQVEVPLQDPNAPAQATLRSLPPAAALRFDLLTRGSVGRTARASRVGPRREQPRWVKRLSKIAVGVVKFVMAVELAALLSGSTTGALLGLLRATVWGESEPASSPIASSSVDTEELPATSAAPGEEAAAEADGAGVEPIPGSRRADGSHGSGRRGRRGGSGSRGGVRGDRRLGSETEAALEAVVEYADGRRRLEGLEGHEPERLMRAMEAVDTELLEQMGVANPKETSAAVRQALSDFKQQDEQVRVATATADTPRTALAAADEVGSSSSSFPPPAGEPGAQPTTRGTQGQEAQAVSRTSNQVASAVAAAPQQEPLPGFGPASAPSTAAGARGRGGSRT